MSLSRDTLFIIKAPFEDRELEGTWFCTACATMEGALLANPHWANRIDVKRNEFPRPRREIINLIGEENQSMPVLVLADGAPPPPDAKQFEGRYFLDDPKPITRYLAATHGGAGPHP
ncbi:MAG: DUF3088 family protein [Hyphomonadaceae bacterium]|nr:DUF3088 family protein [Hyphomonadaceae bacterium]